MNKNECKSKCKIDKIGVTDDTLTGRGGMALFVKYLNSVEIYPILQSLFGDIRRNNKGLAVWNIFKQIFCWFYDGTSRHLNYFDQLKGTCLRASHRQVCVDNREWSRWDGIFGLHLVETTPRLPARRAYSLEREFWLGQVGIDSLTIIIACLGESLLLYWMICWFLDVDI